MGYKLMDICSEWLIENGKPESQLARIYTIALSGLRELHMDINGIVKIVELSINDNDTADLPNDYVKYSKVGIAGADGRIHSLGLDSNLNLNTLYNSCGTPIAQPNNISSDTMLDSFGLPFVIVGTQFQGGLFGLGGGNNALGYFKINSAKNQIQFGNLLGTNRTVILEYIGDIQGTDDDFIVHPFAIETVKNWVAWKYVIGDRNTSLGEKQMRERRYFLSKMTMNKRYNSSTIQEWSESLRKSNFASVRF